MTIKKDDIVTVFAPRETYEAPVTRTDEDSEIFSVTLKAGGRMAFNFPNPFGNCEGVGHNITAKVKG